MSLDGKVAFVTGAGRGIGKVIALQLSEAGAKVGVLDVDKESSNTVRDEIISKGGNASSYSLDITDSLNIKGAFDVLEAELGELNILVNCAGIGCYSMVDEMGDEEWLRTINVNLNGSFYCSREAFKRMKKRKHGRIINISSLASKRISVFGGAAYTASKAGINGFTRHLAYEAAPFGITVNAICPGETMTEMTEKSLSSEILLERIKMNPSGRLATPEDHANLVIFLAEDKSNMINGQLIDVDGGSALAWMDIDRYTIIRNKNK